MKQKNKQPKLRFPQFDGDWEEKRLGEISENIMYGINTKAVDFDGTNKYIRITDIDESSRMFCPSPLTSPREISTNKYLVNKNDILFVRTGASVGKTYHYVENDGKLFFAGFLIRFNIKSANSYYIFLCTLTFSYKKWVNTVSMRSGQPGINALEYKSFKIHLPSLAEQEKIADFFSTLDAYLGQKKQRLALLQEYKRGMMQQLFSGQKRFQPDAGGEFPAWKKVRLGEIGEVNPSSKTIPQEFIYIDLDSVENGVLKKQNFIKIENAPSRAKRVLKPYDILYQTVRPYQQNNLLFKESGNYVASTGYAQIRTKQNSAFLYHALHTQPFLKKVLYACTGTSYPAINSSDLKQIKISLPSIGEQKKIAEFLEAIDDRIKLVEQSVAQLESWKKGLLQELLV